jgi:aerobic carbon-monoxide dehydrogenase small subunit
VSATVTVKMNVNGGVRRMRVPPMKRLLDVLRDECGLTGSKECCGEGECGACTVLLNGAPVNACLIPAIHADGADIVTVEGLARGGRLVALQRAFVAGGAAQCGMCTPGMLVTASALLSATKGRVPDEDEVRRALAGTLCRCTGYQKIVDAVRAAAAAGVAPKRAGTTSRRAPARKVAPGKSAARALPARKNASGKFAAAAPRSTPAAKSPAPAKRVVAKRGVPARRPTGVARGKESR